MELSELLLLLIAIGNLSFFLPFLFLGLSVVRSEFAMLPCLCNVFNCLLIWAAGRNLVELLEIGVLWVGIELFLTKLLFYIP